MIPIDIPAFGVLTLEHFVTDFSGTLSEDGKVLPEVKERAECIVRKTKGARHHVRYLRHGDERT